jgi:hypothetical protein
MYEEKLINDIYHFLYDSAPRLSTVVEQYQLITGNTRTQSLIAMVKDGDIFLSQYANDMLIIHMHMEYEHIFCVDRAVNCGSIRLHPRHEVHTHKFSTTSHVPYTAMSELPYDWEKFRHISYSTIRQAVDRLKKGLDSGHVL